MQVFFHFYDYERENPRIHSWDKSELRKFCLKDLILKEIISIFVERTGEDYPCEELRQSSTIYLLSVKAVLPRTPRIYSWE